MFLQTKRAYYVALAVLFVVTGASCVALHSWAGLRFIDLLVYQFGGQHALAGDLYTAQLFGNGLPYTYSPFAALLMLPFKWLHFNVLLFLWQGASICALADSLRRVASKLAIPQAHLVGIGGASVALVFEPVRSTLDFGQINLLLMWMIIVGLTSRRRYVAALIGIAAAIKLTPLMFVFYLFFVKKWRRALIALGAFVAANLASALVLFRESWAFWTSVTWQPERVGGVAYASNQSAMGVLWRLIGHKPSSVVWAAVAGVLGLLLVWLGSMFHKKAKDDDGYELLGYLLSAFAMLIVSPISWSHHWVWAAPLLLVSYRLFDSWRPRIIVSLTLIIFILSPMWRLPMGGDKEVLWNWWQQILGNCYFEFVLVLTVACGISLWRMKKSDAAPALGKSGT